MITHISGVAEQGMREGRIGEGVLVGQPRDHPGKRDAAGHVVVDADHVGPQTHVVGDRAIGPYAAQGGIVAVEFRHLSVLSYARNGLWAPGAVRAYRDSRMGEI